MSEMQVIVQDFTMLRSTLGSARYPFTQSRGTVRISDHAVPDLPHASDIEGMLTVASNAVGILHTLRGRVQFRLAAIAEQAEQAAGFAPLAEPPSESASTASR